MPAQRHNICGATEFVVEATQMSLQRQLVEDTMNNTPDKAQYVQNALEYARYRNLPEDGTIFGEVPGLRGVYANAETEEACRNRLAEVLSAWVSLRIKHRLKLPSPSQGMQAYS